MHELAGVIEMHVEGPVTQSFFLQTMGIKERLEQLVQHQTMTDTSELLVSGVERLVSSSDMGNKFKFMAITQSVHAEPLIGFHR
jgi:SAM-dependent MidA family methyltransferase